MPEEEEDCARNPYVDFDKLRLRSCPEPRSGSGTAVAERQIAQSALMISPWRTAN